MKKSRSPIYSRYTRSGFPPLLAILVVGCAASVMDIWGGYSVPVITLSAVVLTVAIALWNQIAGYRRTAQIEKRLREEAPNYAGRTDSR